MYATHDFGDEQRMTNSYGLIKCGCDKKKEEWIGKVLLLFRCFVRGGGNRAMEWNWYS